MVFLLSSESLVHFWKLKLFSHSFPFSVWWHHRRRRAADRKYFLDIALINILTLDIGFIVNTADDPPLHTGQILRRSLIDQ